MPWPYSARLERFILEVFTNAEVHQFFLSFFRKCLYAKNTTNLIS